MIPMKIQKIRRKTRQVINSRVEKTPKEFRHLLKLVWTSPKFGNGPKQAVAFDFLHAMQSKLS